jgi:hypothetical protein
VARCWGVVHLVKREPSVTRERKAVDRQCLELLLRLAIVWRRATRARLQLCETVRDEEDQVDEKAVGGALDLKVAEQAVGAEQVQCLVDDVWRRRVSWEGSVWMRELGLGDKQDRSREYAPATGAEPRAFVGLKGSMPMFPANWTDGSLLNAEWYACGGVSRARVLTSGLSPNGFSWACDGAQLRTPRMHRPSSHNGSTPLVPFVLTGMVAGCVMRKVLVQREQDTRNLVTLRTTNSNDAAGPQPPKCIPRGDIIYPAPILLCLLPY